VVIPKTCQQYLGHAILKIMVKKTLIEISLSRILDPNGNWQIGQIRSCTSL
jgi:RNase P/RNase MRP subunit p30